jgi:translation initiation factor IF-2
MPMAQQGDAAIASDADMSGTAEAAADGAVQADTGADASPDAEAAADVEAPAVPLDPAEARRAAELAELREIEAEEERRRDEESRKLSEANARRNTADTAAPAARPANDTASEPFGRRRRQAEEVQTRRPAAPRRDGPGRRQSGKMTITQALSGDEQRPSAFAGISPPSA